MTREEIERIVIEEIVHITNIHPSNIATDSSLDDLDLDNIDKVEIKINLEDYLGIDIEVDTEENWQTVRDIVECVERLV